MKSLEEIIKENKEADEVPKITKTVIFKQIKETFSIDTVTNIFIKNKVVIDIDNVHNSNCLSSNELILVNKLIANKQIELNYIGLGINNKLRITITLL